MNDIAYIPGYVAKPYELGVEVAGKWHPNGAVDHLSHQLVKSVSRVAQMSHALELCIDHGFPPDHHLTQPEAAALDAARAAIRDGTSGRYQALVEAAMAIAPFMKTWLSKFPSNDSYGLEMGSPDQAEITRDHAKSLLDALDGLMVGGVRKEHER